MLEHKKLKYCNVTNTTYKTITAIVKAKTCKCSECGHFFESKVLHARMSRKMTTTFVKSTDV